MVTQATSVDGTTIGYRTTGGGPGLVVVHGALQTSSGYEKFAELLADEFTVHVIDRRGRELSGPHTAEHSLKTEVEDVAAVVHQTGAQRVFGLSSGALIALETALTIPGITHVAAYEPPITAPGLKQHVFERFEKEVAAGKSAEAMVTILLGLEVGPRWLRLLPRPLLLALTRKLAQDDEEDMVGLLPTARYDFGIVNEGSKNLERFKELKANTALLGGSKSARYLKDALAILDGLIPHATRTELRGADHGSPTEGPQLVVPELKKFLSSGSARARTR
ncbi:alpha/beta hydrolase [Lentzea sp. NPDC005914]|uniref:alpha/beta fold hydrolase n=1 Tax=Lentzea sp. NPDC005914 TaxID=3154572 RepID=UPI0033FDD76E